MSYLIYLMVYVIKLLSAKTWICLYIQFNSGVPNEKLQEK